MLKIKTLTGAGLVVRLDAQGGLVVEGLKSIDPKGAEELRRYIRENKAQIIEELQTQAQGGPVILEESSIENPAPCPETAALEILDMARRDFIRLHADQSGGFWWTAPDYENDPGSLAFIADVWLEACPAMFRLMESGGLDHLLTKRATSATPAQPVERPRKKRITPAMMERYRRARPRIEDHMPELLAQGWTRRTLFRAGRHPYPFSEWGLAWSSNWTASNLVRVEITSDCVGFVLAEPNRTVRQVTRCK
ncbi:hypothetical protein [Desulfonatronum thiodismutans]|uniref:hypothetical protein n=1 Tax=Desulfonatronum thiodismutans TaxID=159290 RepID=UPI0004ABECE4|nr:hypothetical protein [Desulfonatronum thiodismutans]